MSKESALDRYARAVEKRDEHIKANKTIFDHHESIVMEIIDAENDLRDAVAENFAEASERAKTDPKVVPSREAGIISPEFTVTIAAQAQTWADIQIIDEFLKQGKISKEVRDVIVRTENRPPKISIRKN